MTTDKAISKLLRLFVMNRGLPGPVRYGAATIVIVVVMIAQHALFGSSAPWFLYTPAVVLVAVVLGPAAAVWSTLISAVGAASVVVRPGEPFWLSSVHWAASAFFIATTFGLIGLVQALRVALLEADGLRAERERDLVMSTEREAFLSGVLSSSTDCIKVLDLEGRLIFMSEGGKRVMEVDDFSAVANQPWPDFWKGAGNVEALAAVEAAKAGHNRTFSGEAATQAGNLRWWSVAVSPILGPDGRPERILSIARDITVARLSEEASRALAGELAFERATLSAVFENAPVGLSLAAADGASVLLNEQMRIMLGRDISQGGIDRYLGAGAIHPDGNAYSLEDYPQVRAIREAVETRAASFLIKRPDGSRLRTEISSVPLVDGGDVTGAVSVVVDVEERERAIERQALLTAELAHRMKNTMAMVQAILHQSLRSAVTLEDARENVISRFQALVRAQDLLTQGDWRPTDLGDLVRSALETFDDSGQITIVGPAQSVGARAALSFTLVLHELATNATKYGALSTPEGAVTVMWDVAKTASGQRLTFNWSERGGPEVTTPSRKGFGTRLIETMGRMFGGSSETRYDPSGVSWSVDADAERIASN